jgi:serine/threonine protein kinase
MESKSIDCIYWEAAQIASEMERAAYLERVCGADSRLHKRVVQFLKVRAAADELLEAPPACATLDEPLLEKPGMGIGPYKLLEQIGEGGMGLVFMAEQARPVRRKVALKVLKPGMDTRQIVTRFEAERQALALMDHPHIARIHDGGTTASGRPYFVMELVRGVPITEFCDQRRLPTRQRLELFVTVCQAVQHAHQKGIIHRDLKPSNVLVTLHDTVAVPKVIDFGIAKATTGPLTERTLFTHFAQMVGTPLYMSPEQAEMNGLDVDTRSDVYSLGVLLYELLTGTTPFEGETLKKLGLDEMRRIIREAEPPTPSQRLNTLDAQACSTVSERRGVDGRRLGQVLRGELDWVVMKALEKDRNRRYESASAFAADVQRYLNDEAVAACPPSAGYRLRKYTRRNRRILLTAGMFTAVLVAATVVSTWQAVRARDAQQQAEADRDRAVAAEGRAATEAAIARAVSDFLQGDLLGHTASAPRSGQELVGGPYLTVREALDRAAVRIGQRFQDQPLVEASIRMAIGEAYGSVGMQQLAVAHLERAVALRKAQLGPDHPDTLASMHSLADACSWVGRHLEAITLRQQILENRQTILGPDHPETLSCVGSLSDAYWAAGKWDASVQLFEQLLEKQRVICGPTHPSTLDTMHSLAMNYEFVDRLAESIALHESVLEHLRSTTGPEGQIWCMMTFAQVCQRAGKLDQSERLLREALEQIRKQEDCLKRRNTIANTLGWLARTLQLKGQYAEAERLAREAVASWEKEQPVISDASTG